MNSGRNRNGVAVQATAHARIHAALKQSLMDGDYKPGERIVVRHVAEQFSTSPMPVREALRQLVSDGALFDHPNRGVIVPEATVEIVSDLVRVRCVIEGAATEWAASTVSQGELADLVEINAQMISCVETGSTGDYLALNRQFHFSVYRAARSAAILPVIERLWLRVGPWLNIMRDGTFLGLGLDHHGELLEALHSGSATAARRAMVADITDAADIIVRAVSRPAWDDPAAGRSRRPAIARKSE